MKHQLKDIILRDSRVHSNIDRHQQEVNKNDFMIAMHAMGAEIADNLCFLYVILKAYK